MTSPLLPLAVAVAASLVLGIAAVGVRLIRQPLRWADLAALAPDNRREQRKQVSILEGVAGRMERWAVDLVGEKYRDRTEARLGAAGYPSGVTAASFIARKVLYTAVFGVLGLLFAVSGSVLLGLSIAAFGAVVQDQWLNREVRQRQSALERELPDFLDVLSVTVEAGVGFTAALRRVAEVTEGPLGEEIRTTLRQMDFGESRRMALQGLRDRNQSDILAEFISALLQAMELGAPLAQALRTMADDLRTQWYQKARREAARAAPRISIIVSFTLVPGSMIIIVAAFVVSSGFSIGGLTGG